MFSDALSAIFNDSAHVTRRTWNNRAIYLHLDTSQRLCTTWNSATSKVDGLSHPWVMTDEDWFASDWEVVE